ncbi:MAG: electron transport complex subunit RsxC [Spirochaetes bacterium]|jgi:electron transport complex protein RnfC|nr:electron transport complex subunit RsxC [Spirochaetota bacterium]
MSGGFRGGIHPHDKKNATNHKEFLNLPIPQRCFIPLQQHIGAPAKAIVKAGDHVEEGQLIGSSDGFISADVHSSIPGRVIEIIDHLTIYYRQPTVVIEAEGQFSASAMPRDPDDWGTLSGSEIISRIKSSGMVGLGGAAFPTSVKLSPPPEKKIDTLLVNGAECEPYLTVDDALMRKFSLEIIEGTRITMRALGVKKAVIGIEDNKQGAINAMRNEIRSANPPEDITVKSLKTRYPQGAEKQLIYSILGRIVPSRGLPMDIGVVVQNVGTVFAIREAVVFKKPLFERFITVGGDLIGKPGNYKVRIGSRISDIIEECGGLKGAPVKIVVGGPMCGLSVHSMDIPVVKGTSGILFLSDKIAKGGPYLPCIRCGKCVKACPMGLLPCELGNAAENERFDLSGELNPFDCIMCGSCSYVCPSHRPLSHFIKVSQQKITGRAV